MSQKIKCENTGRVITLVETAELLHMYNNVSAELKNCRNELCLKCGNYRNAHNGACDDCRYRHGGEWEENFNG